MSDKEKIKEVILFSEKVTANNVKACVDHSNETRKIVRDQNIEIQALKNLIQSLMDLQKIQGDQIATLLQKAYQGGTG